MKDEIKTVFQAAVLARVEKNNHIGWGADDSLYVIEQLADAAYSTDEGFDAIRDGVAAVINPSQFRQVLEKLPKENPRHLVPTEGKKTRGAAASLV